MSDKTAPVISVILPVYNVADYIDICMESLVNQTFSDFEMLLINDGSGDGSSAKCHEWAAKDARVRVIDKENEGVAATRNLGVQLAKGTYLAFVDPDDWVETTYLEKLLAKARETGADVVECDLWRYDNRSGKKIYRSCYGQMGRAYTLREHMKYGPTASYKMLVKRSLWIDNGVRMPSVSFESPAVYSLVLALGGRVESVREPLYYYRRFRENSLIENGYADKEGKPNNTLAIEAMGFLINEFKRCGLYETYQDTLEGVVKYRLSDILATQFYRKAQADYVELVQNYRTFLGEAFPEGLGEPYLTWGGYNLNRILCHMDWLHDPYARFNFSSLVAICGNSAEYAHIDHKNRYRRMMLEREAQLSFWDIAKELHPKYIFMDLLEERFDLVERDGRIRTRSDAYEGSPSEMAEGGRLIPRGSEECEKLWKESAKAFLERLGNVAPGIRVVVLENYLTERVGDLETTEPFPELEEIRRTNAVLAGYYAYLRKICPDAVWIRTADEPLYFTDKNYEYGAVPSHLNEIANRRIAKRIQEALSPKEEETT